MDQRFGTAIRQVRIRRGWRQRDLASRARVSQSTVSRIERGHLDSLALSTIRRVAVALDVHVDIRARWRAGDLDRLLNARHSALHEAVAAMFAEELPDWVLAPEVSFAIYGERGVIDILAWHPIKRALLVIELKTDISDVNELIGTVDRKRRLAAQIARERGWDPMTVSTWVIVAAGRTNDTRIAAHRHVFRNAFPVDGRLVHGWLRDPGDAVLALSMWRWTHPRTGKRVTGPVRRVRRPQVTTAAATRRTTSDEE